MSPIKAAFVQQFIGKHFALAGVFVHRRAIFNYLDTMIALVEAGEGIAVACARSRRSGWRCAITAQKTYHRA